MEHIAEQIRDALREGRPVPLHELQSELRLLDFVQWKGSRPPTTVYLRPVLEELRSRPRRPLDIREEAVAELPGSGTLAAMMLLVGMTMAALVEERDLHLRRASAAGGSGRSRSSHLAPTPKRRLGASSADPSTRSGQSVLSGPSRSPPDRMPWSTCEGIKARPF